MKTKKGAEKTEAELIIWFLNSIPSITASNVDISNLNFYIMTGRISFHDIFKIMSYE
jgi:hypothetical protein